MSSKSLCCHNPLRNQWLYFLCVSLWLPICRPAYVDIPCQWDSKTGSTFDLRPLIVKDSAYSLTDGDIPCTPEKEPSYSFVWNFCSPVPSAYIPAVCSQRNKTGVVLQYLVRQDDYRECHVIGKYDSAHDDLIYSLLDVSNPAAGISLLYAKGDRCEAFYHNVYRSATIEVQCANVKTQIVSAYELSTCHYQLVMKSYYGCPTECPVTSAGLCSSHGYCKYDKSLKRAHCFCNQGYYGDSCSSTTNPSSSSSSGSTDGHSTQVGLLITLLILALGLLGVVGFMVYRITLYRKEQAEYSSLPGGTELVTHF
jgi:hypothetical protein